MSSDMTGQIRTSVCSHCVSRSADS